MVEVSLIWRLKDESNLIQRDLKGRDYMEDALLLTPRTCHQKLHNVQLIQRTCLEFDLSITRSDGSRDGCEGFMRLKGEIFLRFFIIYFLCF